MAGPFGKPTGTRPKSRGSSEHRDSLGSSASFLSRDLGLDLPGSLTSPYFPSRDDAGYTGEHRREMMQQPDGEEQVARNQRQGMPQFPNNQTDNQPGGVRGVSGVSQYNPNNQIDGHSSGHASNRGVSQYSGHSGRGVSQYPNNQVDGHATTRVAPQYSNNQVDGVASGRGVIPSSEERRSMSLEMSTQADVNMLIRSHEAVNANLAALREKLERVQDMDVMEDGGGRDRQARALRNQLNNLQELELEARRAHLNNSVSEVRLARNMAKNETRDERSEELLSEKMSLVSKLAELEERKRQMDSMLVQYNNVSELSQQFARTEIEGGEKDGELRDLKKRLRELQDMVTDLDRPMQPSSTQEDGIENSLAMLTAQYEKTTHTEEEQQRSGNLVPPPMALLNHWSGDGEGQINLQAEMKEKREQLEQLMRKDVLNANLNNETDQQTNINKTEFFRRSMAALEQVAGRGRMDRGELPGRSRAEQGVGRSRSKETNSDRSSWNEGRAGREDVWETGSSRRDLPGWLSRAPRAVPQNRGVGRSSRGDGLGQNTSQQLAALQVQVNKLKGDLGKLSTTPSALPQPTPSRNGSVFGSGDGQHLQQLTQSVNQVYQALWGLQREVTGLGERVRHMENSSQDALSVTPDDPPGGNSWDSHQENISWPGGNSLLGSAWATPQPTLSWPQDQHLSPYPNPDLWNSLQASPGFVGGLTGLPQVPNTNNFLQSSEPDSGVSSGALNNQVSPGVRANNYYDNFRSFSHQNRFTTTGVNQGRGRGQLGPAAPTDPAPVNNSTSSTRPRRKYKINSEQNRDQRLSGRRRHGVGAVANSAGGGASSTAGGTAGSTVTAASSNGLEVAAQPANVTGKAVVDNLTKDIYNQVGSLISQHNNVPEMLARLLQDLNKLERGQGEQEAGDFQPNTNDNVSILSSSTYTSEEGERPPPTRMFRNKTVPKRLSGVTTFAVTNSGLDHDSSDTVGAASNAPPHSASSSTGHAYLVGGEQLQQANAPSWQMQQPSVAVPKNQQKNMISRERDARKMPGWRERLLPRNMQVLPGVADQGEFVNIQLELPGNTGNSEGTQSSRQDNLHMENLSQPHSFSDMAEAELAEADQIHEPGESNSFMMDQSIAAVRDPDSPLRPSSGPGGHGLPLMVGLDRVPIRLPSTGSADLDQRRLVEEESVASIVEEVLASSPELVGDGAAALPPGQKD